MLFCALLTIFLTKLSAAACLDGLKSDLNYPGPAKYTVKIWNENLFTAQVMRILLNDVFDQDVEFYTSNTDLDQVITSMAGVEKGFDSKDALFWNLISEVPLSNLRRTNQYGSKFLVLPLGSGAPEDYYKVMHPGLSLELPYISHLLTLVNFASDKIEEGDFITYDTPADAYNASCEWLQENTDLVALWTPWIEFKKMKSSVIYVLGILLMIISFLSVLVVWLLLGGMDAIRRSVQKMSSSSHELPDLGIDEEDDSTAKKWIRAGDVISLVLICTGSCITGMLVFVAKRSSDTQCNTFVFVMHGGVLIVIGSLTARTDKLLSIFNFARGKSLRTKFSFWRTWLAWVILPSVVVFLYLFICWVLVPLKSTWFVYGESFYTECVLSDKNFMVSRDGFISMEKVIIGIPSIIEGFLGLRLIQQLWNLEGLEDQYNEHSQILCVLFVLGLTIATTCVVEIITMNPYTKDSFQIGLLLLWHYFVQIFMFWPRFWRACKHRKIGDGFIKKEHLEEMRSTQNLSVEVTKTEHRSKPSESIIALGDSNATL